MNSGRFYPKLLIWWLFDDEIGEKVFSKSFYLIRFYSLTLEKGTLSLLGGSQTLLGWALLGKLSRAQQVGLSSAALTGSCPDLRPVESKRVRQLVWGGCREAVRVPHLQQQQLRLL